MPNDHMGELQVPEKAAEAVAREQWMRVRIRDASQKKRPSALAPWDHLSDEVRDQKLHEARQDIAAALPAISADIRDRLLGEAGKALDDPQLLNGFAGIVNAVLPRTEGEDCDVVADAKAAVEERRDHREAAEATLKAHTPLDTEGEG